MIKKIFPWIVFISLFALIIIGFSSKNKLNKYASTMMQKQASPAIVNAGKILIDSLYNYTNTNLEYKVTFLEFGSSGCSSCRRMETVMATIQTKYSNSVNVVFRNVSQSENLDLMKYYGIASIPTQIFLDEKGEEIFRHTGFISVDEIEKEVLKGLR